MRRAIGPLWPILSAVHGLHPWDVERLTVAELNDYVAHAARLAADAPPAAAPEPDDGLTSIPI